VAVVLPLVARDSFLDAIRKNLPFVLTDDSHITDFGTNSQEASRKTVFTEVKSIKAFIVYEAITNEGFHYTQYVLPEEMKQQAKAVIRGSVKLSNSHYNPQAHAELLANAVSKVRGMISDLETEQGNDPKMASIEFLFDQVDAHILCETKNLIADIDSAGLSHTDRVTGFDTVKKKIVEGMIAICSHGLGELPLPQYTVSICPKSNHGIFAADVIANALYYHLHKTIATKGRTIKLNQPEAIEGFALQEYICGFSDNDASDILYGFLGDNPNA